MKYLIISTTMLLLISCQNESSNDEDEWLQHIEFTPVDGPKGYRPNPNDRALEDADPKKLPKK